MLEPNDEPRGSLAQYDVAPDGSLHFDRTIIDSLFRPVFVREFDADGDGRNDFLIAEFGDNRGRLALYRSTGSGGGTSGASWTRRRARFDSSCTT